MSQQEKPSRATLQAYLLGQLRDEQHDRVEAYLANCEEDPCHEIELNENPLILRLQQMSKERVLALADTQTVPSTFPDGLRVHRNDQTGGSNRKTFSPLSTGEIVGQFKIGEQLGAGAMGVVFQAHDQLIDRNVALKVVRLPGADDNQGRDRVQRLLCETRSIGKLNHPNIVTVYSAAVHEGWPYLVMELAHEGSLRDQLVQHGKPSSETAVQYVIDACRGLEAAHQAGLVHRDVKPENLLLFAGRVKVADFGLAVATVGAQHFAGTPFYMSPEQFCGRPATQASDIYSLGVTLYELLLGKRPFESEVTPLSNCLAHLNNRLPAVDLGNSSVFADLAASQNLNRILQKATAKKPSERYSSCEEFGRDLQQLLLPEKTDEQKIREIKKSAEAAAAVPLLIVAIALLTLLGLSAWVISNVANRQSFTTSRTGAEHREDGANVAKVLTGKVATVDRKFILRGILDRGGFADVRTKNQSLVIENSAQIPKGEFEVVWIELSYKSRVDDQFLANLSVLTELEGLSLRGTDITDAGVESLSNLENLRVINISETKVGDSGFAVLSALPRLKEVKATATSISNAGVRKLTSSALTHLTLNDTSIDDEAMEFVAKLEELQLLCLRGTNVTDLGIKRIRQLQNLQSVNLCDLNLSDASVTSLAHLANLRELSVSIPNEERSQITLHALEALRSKSSNLAIRIFDSAHQEVHLEINDD